MNKYLEERLLPAITHEICTRNGIEFESLFENWLLRLEKNGVAKWIVGYQVGLNSAASLGITRDKALTYNVLARASIPAVPHYLIKSIADDAVRLRASTPLAENIPYLLKPLKGSGGEGFLRRENLQEVVAAASESIEKELAISPFLAIASESRLIMLDDELLLAFKKSKPKIINDVPMFNLSQGAIPREFSPEASVVMLAINAMKECGLRLAAVDVVSLHSGEILILELNNSFSLDRYAGLSDEKYREVSEVYEKIISKLFDAQYYNN